MQRSTGLFVSTGTKVVDMAFIMYPYYDVIYPLLVKRSVSLLVKTLTCILTSTSKRPQLHVKSKHFYYITLQHVHIYLTILFFVQVKYHQLKGLYWMFVNQNDLAILLKIFLTKMVSTLPTLSQERKGRRSL